MCFLKDRTVRHHAPDEQSLRGKTGVESSFAPILEQEIFAAIGAHEQLEAFVRRAFDGRENELLLH